jgi:hypothetical protein
MAAVPFPRVDIVRIAAALDDRTGVDIAVIDFPVVCGSAAREFGRRPSLVRLVFLERIDRAPGFPSAQQRA